MKEKKTEVITFRTTTTVKQYLESEAEKQERTPAWLVDKIVTEYIKKQEKSNIQININHNESINF